MSRIVNDDPASLAVAASVARRGAIGIGEASAELATLTRRRGAPDANWP